MNGPAPAYQHDVIALWAPRAIVAVTVAALVLVTFDTGGPVRSVSVGLALLVAPGLATSLVMGQMSIEARVLVSLIGSVAILTTVATVMALTRAWSPTAGVWIIGLATIALLLVFLMPGGDGAFDGVTSGSQTDSTTHVSSRSDGSEHEGGLEHGE